MYVGMARLTCTIASVDRPEPFSWLRIAVGVAEDAIGAGDAQLIGIAREVTPFEPGAADKAVAAAADDSTWIPAAWREEDAS